MKKEKKTQAIDLNKEEVLTKEDFLKTLKKVTKPRSSEKEKSKTSADRPSGDYSEKRTH